MKSLGSGQSREEWGHRLEGHNCWMTLGLSLWVSHCLYSYGRTKLRLARSTQRGERNLPTIPGVEQTPESGPLLEGCPELLAAILPCPSRPFVYAAMAGLIPLHRHLCLWCGK